MFVQYIYSALLTQILKLKILGLHVARPGEYC